MTKNRLRWTLPGFAWLALALGLLAGCGATSRAPLPAEPRMQALAGGAVSFLATEIAPGATASPDGLPVGVRLAGDELVLTRYGDGPAVRVLTFERAGERAAYGAYGLLGAKNGIAVGRPLHGDPVAWDQRDHRAALEHQLALVGLPAQTAAELVAAQDAAWFGDGLRVFFALQRAADVLLVQVEVAPGA